MLNFDFECNKTLSICQERERAVRWSFFLFSFFMLVAVFLAVRSLPPITTTTWCSITASPPTTTITAADEPCFPVQLNCYRARFPSRRRIFSLPPNALRLQWRSVAGGSWETELRVVSMRNRPDRFSRRHSLHLVLFAGGNSRRRFALHSTGRRTT